MKIVMLRCNGCGKQTEEMHAFQWATLRPITASGPVDEYCPDCIAVARKAIRDARAAKAEAKA